MILLMSNKIKHIGVVDGVEDGCVCVRILQSSACSGCKVASHCNAAETKEKIIEVMDVKASSYHVGDRVIVIADAAVGFRASLYAYLIPLALMVGTLVAVIAVSHSEGMAALLSLGVLIPYYIVLYLLREKLKNKLNFRVSKS